MADTYESIRNEADRRFGKGASDAKFEWRRRQQAAAGLELEKKTRGGVAGAYDRNKKLVQAALPTLAGILVPGAGALAGAAVGGLARGLDRPGKGGVGLDFGQAARGALAGAGLGSLGSAARTGMQSLLAPKAPAPGAAPSLTTDPSTLFQPSEASQQISRMGSAPTTVTPQIAPPPLPTVAQITPTAGGSMVPPILGKAAEFGTSALDFVKENPLAVSQALQAGLGMYQTAQEAELERQMREEEQERRRRLARLLAPALQAQAAPPTGR